MKILLVVFSILFIGCSQGIAQIPLKSGIANPVNGLLEIIDPKTKGLLASLTPVDIAVAVAVVNQPENSSESQEGEEETPPLWRPEVRWVYMFGVDGNIIVDGTFEYKEHIPETDSFELRVRMYKLQAEQMNKPVQNGGDARCHCWVVDGGVGSGLP